jgi:hypothetical protein
MRAAPAVGAPIGLASGWRATQALLWALAVLAACAWLLAHGGLQPVWAWLAALPTAWLAWQGSRTQVAVLAWDGQQWLLDGAPARVTVAFDLDHALLLRLQTELGIRWLPATARQAGAHWHALRAALYSRAPESSLVAAAPAPPRGVSAPD